MFVQAVVAFPAEIGSHQIQLLDVRAGCAVEDHHMVFNCVQVAPVGIG
jgi:hypothetical protein